MHAHETITYNGRPVLVIEEGDLDFEELDETFLDVLLFSYIYGALWLEFDIPDLAYVVVMFDHDGKGVERGVEALSEPRLRQRLEELQIAA